MTVGLVAFTQPTGGQGTRTKHLEASQRGGEDQRGVAEVLDLDLERLGGVEVLFLVAVHLSIASTGAVTRAIVVLVGGVEPREAEIQGVEGTIEVEQEQGNAVTDTFKVIKLRRS